MQLPKFDLTLPETGEHPTSGVLGIMCYSFTSIIVLSQLMTFVEWSYTYSDFRLLIVGLLFTASYGFLNPLLKGSK